MDFFLGEKPFCCDKCPNRYHRYSSWWTHRRTHFSKGSYKCRMCGMTFDNFKARTLHRKNHEKEKQFCKICSKWFATYKSLNVHNKKFHTESNSSKSVDASWGVIVCVVGNSFLWYFLVNLLSSLCLNLFIHKSVYVMCA